MKMEEQNKKANKSVQQSVERILTEIWTEKMKDLPTGKQAESKEGREHIGFDMIEVRAWLESQSDQLSDKALTIWMVISTFVTLRVMVSQLKNYL